MRLELVKDWMSRDVVVALGSLGLLEASALMQQHNIRRLPVVEDGRLVGIVTQGDLREAGPSSATSVTTEELNEVLAKLTLAEVMSTPPLHVAPESTIGEAADLMLNSKISGLPVIDAEGNLAGIITESDIFRMVVHHWRQSQDDSPKPYTHYEGD